MAELTTVDDIKAHAGITGTADDAVLASMLDAAEAAMRAYCSRPDGWAQDSHTEDVSGWGTDTIILTYTPVADSPAPTVQYRLPDGSYEDLDADTYTLAWPEMGILLRLCGAWPESWRGLRVTYTGGYSTIPDDLATAAIEATLWLYRGRRQDHEMQSESLGGYSYTRAAQAEQYGLPESCLRLLRPYRRRVGQ